MSTAKKAQQRTSEQAREQFAHDLHDLFHTSINNVLDETQQNIYDAFWNKQPWEKPEAATPESQVHFITACRALLASYQAVLKESRRWLAQRLLALALALDDTESAECDGEDFSLPNGQDVIIVDAAYSVSQPAVATSDAPAQLTLF